VIEIHCQLRCYTCKVLKTTILEIQPDPVTIHDMGDGRVSFHPKEKMTILDTTGWHIDRFGYVRCSRH
jgi:hypothetical protein